jgi:hypothetical protein
MFKDSLMRKPDKPSLFHDLIMDFTNAPLQSDVCHVVVGGNLLHKVSGMHALIFVIFYLCLLTLLES